MFANTPVDIATGVSPVESTRCFEIRLDGYQSSSTTSEIQLTF
jgi:hypothetical protein